MLLNFIKEFSVKKILKSGLGNLKCVIESNSIKTVGLLIDQSYFLETKSLIKELTSKGILEENIKVLVYNDKQRKSKAGEKPVFSAKHLNWNASINNDSVTEFINKEFDLLISYYDVEKAILLIVTHDSKAQFKVGFSSVDKRLNHFMINTNAENYKVFTQELFRYLKILNKI